MEQPDPIEAKLDHYDLGPFLGKGAFAVVRQATHFITDEQVNS